MRAVATRRRIFRLCARRQTKDLQLKAAIDVLHGVKVASNAKPKEAISRPKARTIAKPTPTDLTLWNFSARSPPVAR